MPQEKTKRKGALLTSLVAGMLLAQMLDAEMEDLHLHVARTTYLCMDKNVWVSHCAILSRAGKPIYMLKCQGVFAAVSASRANGECRKQSEPTAQGLSRHLGVTGAWETKQGCCFNLADPLNEASCSAKMSLF